MPRCSSCCSQDAKTRKARRLGSDIEGLKKALEQNPDDPMRQNLEHAIKDLASNQLDALRVPDGHVFVIGDDWFRSFDSRHFGPLPIGSIQGKVLGYPADPPAK
ncbi:S26 family signal peptidase [Paenibacillus sp. FSL M7-1455]|uniref:S26 family signal peptidase n=1 Tax=Paenibacillus sp. FSL M7-1455 TaxID=2975316 RepID=UPI0030F7A080